jgi:hypothetical protein
LKGQRYGNASILHSKHFRAAIAKGPPLGRPHPERSTGTVPSDGCWNETIQTFIRGTSHDSVGLPESVIVGIGFVLLASTALYLVPRTAILGAILLTGYLGGAVASKVRVESGWFDLVFPVVFGVLLWSGLWLRDRRLQQLVPMTEAL